ncbi:hypothetical protein B0H13DRAFT_256896 [Mycena leptocephala]|nr:hypothetical protein B0H13DRAFT_256896 [Mycena leptocephala]
MATEIVTILGEDQDIDATAEILRESLRSLADWEGLAWMEEYLGRPRENARSPMAWELEDSYFDIAVVIGYKVGEQHAVLLRVDDFYSEEATWEVVIEEGEDGTESRLARHIYWAHGKIHVIPSFAGNDHTDTSSTGCGILAHLRLRGTEKCSLNNFIGLSIPTDVVPTVCSDFP